MIWKIQSAPHIVVGSIHLLPDADGLFPKLLTAFAQRCSEFVFESDFSDGQLPKLGIDPGMKHFTNSRCREVYGKVAQALGEDVSSIQEFKPWWLALNAPAQFLRQAGVTHSDGIDSLLRGFATKKKAAVSYLESSARTGELLSAWDEAEVLTRLEQIANAPGRVVVDYERIFKAWVSTTLDDMEQLYDEKFKEFPSMSRLVFDQRNEEWLPAMIKKINVSREPTMFVVGVMHCVGSNSIPNLLEREGYVSQYIPWDYGIPRH